MLNEMKSRIPSGKKTILVVDDSPNILKLLKFNLGMKYNVVTASNGAEGLKVLKYSKTPDLVLADIAMPEMDGFDLIKTIRSTAPYKNIPVIFLSAKTQSADRIKGLKLGADDYIIKPFNPEEVELRIENVLSKREMLPQ